MILLNKSKKLIELLNFDKFIIVLILKLILLLSFTSEYNNRLFYEFTSFFITNLDKNPWDHFYSIKLIDYFPYHVLMLYILSPFTFIASKLSFQPIFKLPLIVFDLLLLKILLKMFRGQERKVFLYYFINPIIIYAIYIHSQLDIIPTFFMFYAIYLLINRRYNLSGLVFGLGLATKFHIIVILPIILFYILKKNNFYVIYKYILICFGTILIIDLPFLFSEGFYYMVIMNKKQNLLFDSYYAISNLKFIFPIASIISIYLHFFNQNKINEDLLYFYFGILLTSTIFFIYPSPGWYVWIVPFITIYFIKSKNEIKTIALFSFISLSYLIFFLFYYQSEYKDIILFNSFFDLKHKNETMKNISFTFLEVSLLTVMYAFYKYGIKSNSTYKKQTNLVIGISGDSGVGKSSLIQKLSLLLGDKILQIEGDGDHKWERGNENWNKYTHLNPKANNLYKQADAIYELKHNKTIYRRDYDHTTGRFTEPKKVIPKEFIIIAGLHVFYLPKLRKNIDLKVYIDTDERLRIHWKILRDVKTRGYTLEKILNQINNRISDAQKYIYPQKDYADIIINYYPKNSFNIGDENAEIELCLKITFDANLHIEEVLENLPCDYVWDYNNDLKTQFIDLKNPPQLDFRYLAEIYIDNLNELIIPDAKWSDGYDGFVQFILLKIMSEKMKEE